MGSRRPLWSGLGPAAATAFVWLALVVREAHGADGPARRAREILELSGVAGGLVVHVGAGDGSVTAHLRAGDAYLVHGLDRDPANVERARRVLRERGIYGPVSVDLLRGNVLPYRSRTARLVVLEDRDAVSIDEALRVTAPLGVVLARKGKGWEKIARPWPETIDEWTHYFHDAGGNPTARDLEVGPPRRLQWLSDPLWSRHHDRMASLTAMVTARGRLFYVIDRGSRVSILLPPRWRLVARDAFSGVRLWERALPDWHSHLWPLKSGPTQLARRLVASGDRIYVTLGLSAPLSALDARTGETIRTYEETRATEEVIHSGGTLFAVVNPEGSPLERYRPRLNTGDQGRVAREFLWDGAPRRIVALDAETGRKLWARETPVAPLTLAAGDKAVFYHDGESLVACERSSGRELWKTAAPRRKTIPYHFGPRLVVHESVVLFAGGDRRLRAYDAEGGHELWTAPHPQSAYQSPEDLIVARGLVWCAPTTRPGDSGVYTGRDPLTGEVKVEFPPDVETYWFHHRCHIAKATERFLLPSRTGVEFVDPARRHWEIHHWVRGGCLYGVLPANGLLYAPPHDCACYPEAKLAGFNALRAAGDEPAPPAEPRLERGPAYGEAEEPGGGRDEPGAKDAETGDDWPQYRRDPARSGATPLEVPAALSVLWNAAIGGRLTSPVVSGGRVFTAEVEAHTVHALDAGSGRKLWSFTAGGRIDSPPALWGGLAIFGCRDGSIYAVRARDGRLAWRFRAAPEDRRLIAFGGVESVWPVSGSVLVEDGSVYAVAGRSCFLDGGLRFLRLDARSGEKTAEAVLDDRTPEGGSLQDRTRILNMPVALPDILSSDGRFLYMRSQRLDRSGRRLELGPVSGDPAEQGAAQFGEGRHLFAPMGFLDGTWFHRSYWVYGRTYAGGHSGYYQAAKYTPAGRILVFDGERVYGYGRKPEYLRWTTVLEHELFAAPRDPPPVKAARSGTSMVRVPKSKSLDPSGVELTVEAWVFAERPNGVVLARGGPARGYALALAGGKPRFVARIRGKVYTAAAESAVRGRWAHLAGVLSRTRGLELYIDGERAARAEIPGLIAEDPVQALEIGADDGGPVGDYRSPNGFTGRIDEVRIYRGALPPEAIRARFNRPEAEIPGAETVLAFDFEGGAAKDRSGKGNHGTVAGARPVEGRVGAGLRFEARRGPAGRSFVPFAWRRAVPIFVRAMVLAGGTLFIAGPPDTLDEEEAFAKIARGDRTVLASLEEQDAALRGERGAKVLAVSKETGETLGSLALPSPPVWDGLAAARGRLYLVTEDGHVRALGSR